jgi:hypothetical protein
MTKTDKDDTQIISPLLRVLYCVNIIGQRYRAQVTVRCLMALLNLGTSYRLSWHILTIGKSGTGKRLERGQPAYRRYRADGRHEQGCHK